MEVVITPLVCREENSLLQGTVTIEVPSFDQKYQYMEECNFDVSESGDIKTSKQQLKAIRKMVALSEKHYNKVNIKRKSDGKEFNSFEDLTYDSDCDSILIEMAGKLMSGFKMGKN